MKWKFGWTHNKTDVIKWIINKSLIKWMKMMKYVNSDYDWNEFNDWLTDCLTLMKSNEWMHLNACLSMNSIENDKIKNYRWLELVISSSKLITVKWTLIDNNEVVNNFIVK